VAVDLLWAIYWPVTIHMGLPVYFFASQNWNILANVSSRVFAVDRVISSAQLGATLPFDVHVTLPARFRVIDRVISSAQLGATLPFYVQVTLPARFRVNLYTALWVNKFITPLWVNDRVISAAQIWDILPIDVQVILPARFWVNLYIALWVNKFATLLWVNDRVVSPVQVQPMLPAHFGVNLYTALQWVNDRGYFNNVQLDDHAVQICSHHCATMHSMDDYGFLPIFKKSHVSIWRNPTEQYDVTNHPYFVFHPNQSEFSSFSETFKGYAYCLLQYRLIHVIEFIVCWCNHMCHFMSRKCNNVSQF
jgi:hypothetical protein